MQRCTPPKREHCGALRLPLLATVLAVIAGYGCTLGPDYQPPPVSIEQEWLYQHDTRIESLNAVNPLWWQSAFSDAALDELVALAIDNNLELRSAALRALQAQQLLAIAIGNQYPQVQEIVGVADRSKGSFEPGVVQSEYTLDFNLSWELDMWGQFKRLVKSAAADLEASMAEYDGVLVSIVAQVAQTYINIRTAQRRLVVARENIRLQRESLRIAEVKFQAGEVSALDAEQAQALLSNTQATVPRLEVTLQQLKNTLAVLLGMPPHNLNYLLGEFSMIPSVPARIAIGMPQDLLRQRPDIRQAERLLAAQGEQIGVARAELYPALSIGGSVGTIKIQDGPFEGSSGAWDLFVQFQWNIFNYGRLKSNVRLQDATFQQLLADYQQTVLLAQADVENAIVAYLKSQEELTYYETAAQASKESVRLSLSQYTNGLVEFNTVINTLTSDVQQQDLLAFTQGIVAANLVQVYLSLGGGWQIREDRPPVDLLPEAVKEEMLRRTHYWDKIIE
ncbi:efflux transporter outer membrane subunit [Microbulbifer spongiae]|uniref:Efflux transporter outer membrane subunit n=1 Tax=Microbulbifer spongiae TaxID=2944933 RepID=A0ABY9EFD8_9GAMM|nr:efflux transporter outer membrane subunit [Microbulbifer sp. MI-G]WKD50254.1 efflux transporter outer membrane subunit [Microbulbifer sp. MI-G]